jgi:hypothetical protein
MMLMNSFSKMRQELRLLQDDRADNKGNTAKLEVIALPTATRRNQLALPGDLVKADAET